MDYCEEDIIKTYNLLAHTNPIEIRAVDPNDKIPIRTDTAKTQDEFLKKCMIYSGDYNIFCGINQRKIGGTKKEDIITQDMIVIDIDPIRKRNTASTEEELNQAKEVANKIHLYLQEEKVIGYKALSGNGYHIWIPIDHFLVEDENRTKCEDIIKNFFKFLAEKYNTETIKIDNIGDLPRVVKIIGTKSIKGENTLERPHRISKWIDTPERVLNPNVIEMLKKSQPQKKETQENEKTKFGKLELILKFDKKMHELLNQDQKLIKEFQSRSELEASVVCKLIQYNFSFNEINKIMQDYSFQKWKEATEQYRKYTYEQCNDFVKDKPRTALCEYLMININKITIYPNNGDSIIEINTDVGKIELTAETTLNSSYFRSIYYTLSCTMIPPIMPAIWSQILTMWTKNYGKIAQIDNNTEENNLREKIISELETFTIAETIRESLIYGKMYEEETAYIIPNSHIEAILKREKSNIKMNKLSFIFKDDLTQKSEPRKIRNRSVRFWFFKKQAIKIDAEVDE
jgi:hypothetical protein